MRYIKKNPPRLKERKIIMCACMCGKELVSQDNKGRDRIFLHGHNKGHSIPHTDEGKLRMSKALFGRVIPIEQRKKMGSKKDKNPNWKGGITSINEIIRKSMDYKIWREDVFKKDNYTCTFCKEKESISGRLEADHIKPFAYFPDLRFSLDNGRTLCRECHRKTDTYLWKCRKKYG